MSRVAIALALVDVRSEMLGEVVSPGETLAAHLAVIRPLAGVNTQMPGQVALAAEGTTAEQADERPFAGVLAHVQLQVFFGPHALAAERTSEAPLATVGLASDAPREVDHRLARLVPIVIDGVVVHVAGLAAGTTTAAAAADPADPGDGGLRHLYLDRVAGILLNARGLRDALVTASALGEYAAHLLGVARIGIAAGLHLRRLAGARDLIAALGRCRDDDDAALRLGRALQPLKRVVETVLLKGL